MVKDSITTLQFISDSIKADSLFPDQNLQALQWYKNKR
ncbi:hypothetical protein SAMN05880573_10725 [Chryseobacterium sp. RU33C]|nr:hypothetical protein SAMN05880573_10725 [Chryseobacterium sp. RU33C]